MGFCVPVPVIAPHLSAYSIFVYWGRCSIICIRLALRGIGPLTGSYSMISTPPCCFYIFQPDRDRLAGPPQLTTFAHVQAQFGIRRTSLGALGEAASVFDAALPHAVLTALVRNSSRICQGRNRRSRR